MRQLLTDWKNKHTIVSLFCDENDQDTFLSGYIMDCDEDWVLIGHITPRGEYDGYILKAIDDIIHIESQGKYEAKMELLYSLKNQKHHQINQIRLIMIINLNHQHQHQMESIRMLRSSK